MKKTLLAILAVLLVTATVTATLFYRRFILPWQLAPTEPISFPLSESRIESNFGIQVPPSAKFSEGYCFLGRDYVYVFVFEFSLPDDCDVDSADGYLRQELGLTQDHYTSLTKYHNLFDDNLDELGYSFTHYIGSQEWEWAEIHYRVDGETLLVAMAYTHG